MEQSSQRACEEVIIFKETEDTQVNYQANNKQKLLAVTGCPLQKDAKEIINYRGGKNWHYESWIPPHVKDIACTQEQQLANAKRNAVKQRHHDQKKDPVLKADK